MHLFKIPHRRYNPLTGDWILVSPHRTQRPWQGQKETRPVDNCPQYDEKCYLCPGNERAGGHKNPQYKGTFVFTNDFAALLPDIPAETTEKHSLFNAVSIRGTCRVICYTPRHDLTMAEMSKEAVQEVIDVWAEQVSELGTKYLWVQVFENRGQIMGASNPHPHGQVWASDTLPNEPLKENNHQHIYFKKKQSVLLMDYLIEEIKQKERIVVENEHWVALVPFWAVWPFETMLLPKRHVLRFPDLSSVERAALALLLKSILIRYDNLFNISFPYTMGWHGAPFNSGNMDHWHLHAHIYPPLLRSASIKKFMVGYEMLAEAQRDITAEQTAKRLRNLSDIHFRSK